MKTAIGYGADAVYLGATRFGMRASTLNFNRQQLIDAVSYAHEKGVRVYLTVNTLPRCYEIDELPDILTEASSAGVDAFVAADIGVIKLIKNLLPDAVIHASTQVGIVNHLTVQALYELGVSRVVLARELSLEEIRVIRAKSPPMMEMEAFVHGSMCMSVSGRCVISNYLTDRDANRGECSQPCRWKYHLVEEKRPGVYLPVLEDDGGSSLLSSKDLCMIEHLRKLFDAGITIFKIEGRAKSDFYVGVITNAYRAAIDAMASGLPCPQWALNERKVSTGILTGFI
jgi:putative protease